MRPDGHRHRENRGHRNGYATDEKNQKIVDTFPIFSMLNRKHDDDFNQKAYGDGHNAEVSNRREHLQGVELRGEYTNIISTAAKYCRERRRHQSCKSDRKRSLASPAGQPLFFTLPHVRAGVLLACFCSPQSLPSESGPLGVCCLQGAQLFRRNCGLR